jgi:alpha-L-fucosidase 2
MTSPFRIVAAFALLLFTPSAWADSAVTMWYRQPAQKWEEALPLGNGRLGTMVFGGVQRERISLSETTLWLGKPTPKPFDPRERAHILRQRELTLAGKYAEARALKLDDVAPGEDQATSRPASSPVDAAPQFPNGSKLAFQPLGDLWLHFPAAEQIESDYRRQLDLDSAIHTTTFRIGDATFTRARCSAVTRIKCSSSASPATSRAA